MVPPNLNCNCAIGTCFIQWFNPWKYYVRCRL